MHHLLVPSYLNQPADQLTDEGFAFIRALLGAFATGELPASPLEQRMAGLRAARASSRGRPG